MTSIAFYCRAGQHQKCPLPSRPPIELPHAPSCTCSCHPPKELEMQETTECEVCGRTLRAGPGAASHMRAMHPETLKAPSTNGHMPSSNGNGIRWEEPPMSQRGPTARMNALRAAVPELKRNAGRWARLFDYTGPTTAGSSVGKLRALFPDLELVGRRVDGGSAIFARYSGD